jgi:hypothetical protein
MKVRTLGLCVATALLTTIAFAQETEPQAIFKKTAEAYKTLETYSAEGTIVSDMDHNGTKVKSETSFTIKLKKPNLYLISWQSNSTSRAESVSGPTQTSAIWSDGTQPYLYMGIGEQKNYSKMSNDDAAMAGATGISQGAASTIPSLFFPDFKAFTNPFARLTAPQLIGTEQVGGEECYVIRGSSPAYKDETYWIAKKDFLIRKYAHSLDSATSENKWPPMSDKDLAEALKGMGQKGTPAQIAEMRKMMQDAQKTLATGNLKSVSTESHTNIGRPQLTATEFAYKLPEGAVLKDSLWEGLSVNKPAKFVVKSATSAQPRRQKKRR